MTPPPSPPSRSNLAGWFADEVQPHEVALRAWLRGRFPSLGDHDDLVQESYLRLLRVHAVNPIRSAKAFLFTTARNLAINRLRHRWYEHPEVLGKIVASDVLDETADIPETVARTQEIELLTQAIQSLPERCRDVFTLRRIHGLPAKETARRLRISEKTVDAQCIIALRKCVQFFRASERGTKVRVEPAGLLGPTESQSCPGAGATGHA